MSKVKNSCNFEGTLASDPVLTTETIGGNAIDKAVFRLVTTDEGYEGKQDVKTVSVTAWGKRADFLKNLKQGEGVSVWAKAGLNNKEELGLTARTVEYLKAESEEAAVW